MKQARKLVSGRIPVTDFQRLRDHAATIGETQDAIVARLVLDYLKTVTHHQPSAEVSDGGNN